MNRSLVCRIALLALLPAFFIACEKEVTIIKPESGAGGIPIGFPAPDIPADNALTVARIALGRRLFYDPVLSADSTRSCGSCHDPARAFSDSTAVSLGIQGRAGTRNTPMLANVAYQQRLLREGGVPTLEMQILVPIQERHEFDFNILRVAERLQHSPQYTKMALNAYGRRPDAFVITRAIAAFERSLLSGNSPFDQWHFQGREEAVSASVKRGYALFNGDKLRCGQCHEGFLLTNQGYASNGLYEVYPDSGRMRLTGLESDRGLFKVPSLRNIDVTAPYMHDGSVATLEAVIDHYQSGGKPHPNKSPLLQPFTLSAQERADLLAFLHSLTDADFLKNPNYKSPF